MFRVLVFGISIEVPRFLKLPYLSGRFSTVRPKWLRSWPLDVLHVYEHMVL